MITASDLESIRSLFNEKEKELSIAVAKVEELTRQLEELQRGRDINSSQKGPSAAAGELEKLRAELMVSSITYHSVYFPLRKMIAPGCPFFGRKMTPSHVLRSPCMEKSKKSLPAFTPNPVHPLPHITSLIKLSS